MFKETHHLLTDLLTKPCWIPGGAAAAAAAAAATAADTGGAGIVCGGGIVEGACAPALCGASCGVVL